MSVEIAWKQNILVTDFHLLKSLLVVFGFGSQAFICGFSRQNICSVTKHFSDCNENHYNFFMFYNNQKTLDILFEFSFKYNKLPKVWNLKQWLKMFYAIVSKNSIHTILYAIESQQSLCPLQKITISHMLLYQPTQGYRYIFLFTGGSPFVRSPIVQIPLVQICRWQFKLFFSLEPTRHKRQTLTYFLFTCCTGSI